MTGEKIKDRATGYAALAIMIAGAFLRLNQYAANRSLWLDEAMLALNIVNRSFGNLLGPLDYSQGAPIGFLLVQKTMVTVFGGEDFVLRIFPVMTALAALYLMYRVSFRYVGSIGGLIALGLFSLSGPMVYYASENKQYSTDVFFTLMLLFLVGKCLEKDAGRTDYMFLCAFGTVSIFFSHPALFILSGVGIGLIVNDFVAKKREQWVWTGWTFLIWFICYIFLYIVSLRILASNSSLLNYWKNTFMPWPPWEDLSWFLNTFCGFLRDPAGLTNPPFFIFLLVVAGVVSFFYRRKSAGLVLVVPFAAVLIASAFRKYPASGRLLLFLGPVIYLLIAESLETVRILLKRVHPWASWACFVPLVIYLFMHPVALAAQRVENPEMREHIKPVLAHVQKERSQGDVVYVYYSSWPAFSFYAGKYGFDENEAVGGIRSREAPGKYILDIEKQAGKGRIWVIISHNCFWCPVNEEKFIIHNLSNRAILRDVYKAPGASVYLYDFSK